MTGTVNLTVVPCPNLLSIQNWPPFFSTISWQITRPKPVPLPCSLLGVVICELGSECGSICNSALACSGVIPTPVSVTDTSILEVNAAHSVNPSPFACCLAEIVTLPPFEVNFKAFETRLRITVFSIFWSACTSNFSDTLLCNVICFLMAFWCYKLLYFSVSRYASLWQNNYPKLFWSN